MPDEFVGGGNGGSLPVVANDYGAAASASAATNDAAIALAVAAAQAAGRPLRFPDAGTYQITAAITLNLRGMRISGNNTYGTIIKQTTAAAHGFTIVPDPANPTTGFNEQIIFENLTLQGLGVGTSTGYGINATSDGDWFRMDNCKVLGFERGCWFDGWSQCLFLDSLITNNNYNLYFDDATTVTNTIQLINCGIANAGVRGVTFNQGGGCTIHGGDMVGQPLAIQCGRGSVPFQLTLIGGNFENLTGAGTEFIQVKNSARLVSIGSQFQKNVGNNGDAISVDGGAVLVINPILAGMAATNAIVRKTTSTDIAEVIAPTVNLSTAVVSINDAAGTSYNHARFTQRADNAVPAASITNRGLVLQKMVRDTSNDVDSLLFFARDRSQAANNYGAYLLTPICVAKSAAYTATALDDVITCNATTATFQVTLPTAVGCAGKRYTIKKNDASANAVTVGTTSAQTIDGVATFSLATQWKYVTVCSNGANWLVVANN